MTTFAIKTHNDISEYVKIFNENFKNPQPPFQMMKGRAIQLTKTITLFQVINLASPFNLPRFLVYAIIKSRMRKRGFKVKMNRLSNKELINTMVIKLWGNKKF